MKKNNAIKYLRVGSIVISKHNGKEYKIISRSLIGFRLLKEGETLPTSESKFDMGLYFKRK